MSKNALLWSFVLGVLPLSAALAQDGPTNVPVPLSIRSAVTTSADGLTEEFAISGQVVRLQGRFRSLATATIDADGKVVVACRGPGDNHDDHHAEDE